MSEAGDSMEGEDQRPVAIIGAMDEEVALIGQGLKQADQDSHAGDAGLKVISGTLDGPHGPVGLAATVGGMGTVNIAATTQYLIDAFHPRAVIFSGIAGNLNKDLHINDVVLGGTLRYLDTDMRLVAQSAPGTEEFHSDPHLLDLASRTLDSMGIKHIVGTIATGNYFVDNPEKIAQVRSRPGPMRSRWRGRPSAMWRPVTSCRHWLSAL